MAWVSPTGFSDPSTKWKLETQAYDEDTGTYAYVKYQDCYLELTLTNPISCDKVQIYANSYTNQPYDPDLAISVYYNDGWHEIFTGVITKDTWVEKGIGSTQTVSKAKIKWNTILGGDESSFAFLWEFDFNEVVGGEEKLLTATSSVASSTTGSLTLGRIESLTATSAGATNVPSTILRLLFSITAHAPPATSAASSLSVAKSLSGTSSATSTTTGSLTLGKVESLTATSSTTSSVSGSITLIWSLSGTSQSTSSTQGTLTLGVIEALTGTVSAGTSAQATLYIFKALTATSGAASSATGSLTLGRIETLTATANIQSSVSGQIGLIYSLSGTASVTSTVEGILTIGAEILLTGTAAIASSIQGLLTVEQLSATASATTLIIVSARLKIEISGLPDRYSSSLLFDKYEAEELSDKYLSSTLFDEYEAKELPDRYYTKFYGVTI